MRLAVLFVIAAAACGPVPKHAQPCTADLNPGDLVITEIFADSADGADAGKEWFEVYNNTSDPIELEGLVITSSRPDGSSAQTHVMRELVVAPGQYLTLGNSAQSDVQEYVDYGYGDDLGSLYNTGGGMLALQCGDTLGRFGRLRRRRARPLARVHRRTGAGFDAQRRSLELVRGRRERVCEQRVRHAGHGQRLPAGRRRRVRRQRHDAPGRSAGDRRRRDHRDHAQARRRERDCRAMVRGRGPERRRSQRRRARSRERLRAAGGLDVGRLHSHGREQLRGLRAIERLDLERRPRHARDVLVLAQIRQATPTSSSSMATSCSTRSRGRRRRRARRSSSIRARPIPRRTTIPRTSVRAHRSTTRSAASAISARRAQ